MIYNSFEQIEQAIATQVGAVGDIRKLAVIHNLLIPALEKHGTDWKAVNPVIAYPDTEVAAMVKVVDTRLKQLNIL